MPRYFLDSSALVKRYHQESGTAPVEVLFSEPGNRFFISRLALVELHSCFARLVREGILSLSWTMRNTDPSIRRKSIAKGAKPTCLSGLVTIA